MMRWMSVVMVVVSLFTWSVVVQAEDLRLARIFGDGMVVQRDQEIPVWGWAKPGAQVAVSLKGSGAGRAVTTKAGDDGKWMLRLEGYATGGSYVLSVNSKKETITYSDILMGDVWVCSGQSNMQWPVRVDLGTSMMSVGYARREVANADYPNIRLYTVPMTTSLVPLDDIPVADKGMYPGDSAERLAHWQACSPETVASFSAVAYFFGRDLHKATDVPIGLIQTAWGGTLCEAWTSADTLNKQVDFRETVAKLQQEPGDPVELKKEYELEWAAWRTVADERDQGFAGGRIPWAKTKLDDSMWQDIRLPAIWEKSGFVDLDGYVWFRKEVDVSSQWAGESLELHFTGINDENQTWFNGVQVSDFTDQPGVMTPRKYTIPGALVKAGGNTIAVRVYDMGNQGGFVKAVGTMALRHPLLDVDQEVSLEGDWKIRVGVELKNLSARPSEPLSLGGNPNVPTVLYNAMIEPLIPFGIKGAIWYQGESNVGRAYQYRELFSSMIQDWRGHWGQGDFPFLFVQLANFTERVNEPQGDAWAELREAQTMALSLPNTGMAVAIDIGAAKDIHPTNKQEVGRRLALAARHVAHGEEMVYSGPMYLSLKKVDSGIRINFSHIGGGLKALGGPPAGFSIAGADQKFVWANTRIVDNTIVVWSEQVTDPVAVRYGWAANPLCNVYNAEGLPLSPFRTDDWPGLTVNNH